MVDFNSDGQASWFRSSAPQRFNDYDLDDDGLIEVTTPAQLNAIRWDPAGTGTAPVRGQQRTSYYDAFVGGQHDAMGCPDSRLLGVRTRSTTSTWTPTPAGSPDSR